MVGYDGIGIDMAEKKRYPTIKAYIEDQNGETKRALAEMRRCILEAAPDAAELFNYDIPAFALVENGKRDQQIMIAGYAKHVGFYPHPETIEHFADRLRAYTSGKGSVRFPNTQPLPKALIIEMVTWRKKQLENETITK